MNLLHKSFGHGLALSLFFESAGTLMLSICDVEKSYTNGKFVCGINNRKDFYKALYNGASDGFYGFLPFILRYIAKESAVSYGVPAVWFTALTSSTILGAYKYWTKGRSPYIGGYDNFAYALATVSGYDETLFGAAWTTGLVEGVEAALKSPAEFKKTFIVGALSGAVTGSMSWVLLEGIGLYNKCLDKIAPDILSSALCHKFAVVLGLGISVYNLNQIRLSREPYTPQAMILSSLNVLCVSALLIPAANPIILTSTLVAVLAVMELGKVASLVCDNTANKMLGQIS